MSRSTTTTPLRAIPSALTNKASLTIPPPAQTYEPLVKSVLRHRLTSRIFLLSAAFCWFQTVVLSIWGLGGASKLGFGDIFLLPIRPWLLSVAFAHWLCVAVPVVVLRKIYLTASRTNTTSPSKTWHSAWVKTETQRALLVYCVSSILATVLHVMLAYTTEARSGQRGDPRLTVFVKSKKHPHYLNGRLLFLLISQLTIACGFFVRNVMLDRFVFRWTASSNRSVVGYVLQTVLVVSVFTTVCLPVASLVFGALRTLLPILYQLPILPVFLRPFTAHFLRGSFSILLPLYHFQLFFRAWSLGASTLAVWEASEVLFDAFVAEPVRVSHQSSDPTLTLVSGVASPDRIFKFFALSELLELATNESPAGCARRSDLFADQKYSPTIWGHLCREILLLLGQDYQLLLRRGAPPPLPPPAAPSAPAPQPAELPTTPAKLINQPIFKSSKPSPIRSVIDSFAADGSFPKAVDEGAESVHLPELFKGVENAVLPGLEKGKGEIKRGVEGALGAVTDVTKPLRGGITGVVNAYAPTPLNDAFKKWGEWWDTVRVGRAVESSLPYRELDVLAVKVLSHLVCASLTEDRYGVVQRDTPKILEALLSFLSAVEEYQVEINALAQPASDGQLLTQKEMEKKEDIEKASMVLGFVADGLKEGITNLVRTFGDKLLAFKFPPRTAKKLQGFLDYC
ncbi:hypothetical protein K435DRAFT_751333 [Dendrothele bispora CBS 962.96]|uniref:Nucleoporin protein Ndc1-Nup n=1 Tax=Dendrothele bispora (strain CBS 962.96) TaxID=1314807 RepID=A0A4S8MCV2_DENBC|nr:hypothetical protein K435DRAFT_751333 [Dendrothele bispora CBS 962.96]